MQLFNSCFPYMQMATSRKRTIFAKHLICVLLSLHILSVCHDIATVAFDTKYVFKPADILQIVDQSCFVGFSVNDKSALLSMFADVASAFREDVHVLVGFTDLQLSTKQFRHAIDDTDSKASEIAIFRRMKKDRTCLTSSAIVKKDPKITTYTGSLHLDILVDFVNEQCETYRNSHGHVTIEGLHRKEILQTLFHVQQVSDVTMRKLHEENQHFCSQESCSSKDQKISDTHIGDTGSTHKYINHQFDKDNHMPTCEKVPYPSNKDFFHNYLKISKPVIFTGAMESWPARTKWTNSFLREKYGREHVHIKLTPSGEYEGIDLADQFENFASFSIPSDVKQQLLFPDLVVVRPATANMEMSKFLDIIEEVSNGTRSDFSAYLEYSSLADIMPDLEDDIEEMPFLDHMLELKHLNVWLSDGNTLGKLHFDPFDNFLCQISGKKEVILFEPHDNTRLYEAHIPEAMLEYNQTTKTFHKKTLVDSTSMVMSPVDIRKPDFERFPLFADTHPLNCTIGEGEVLFMPAFWWHEVQSHPNRQQGRNLAVNFWYDPFLVKEFPCQECKLDVNPKYRHLL